MIGQELIRTTLANNIEFNKVPSFTIIEGAEGSGKKTLLRELFPDAVWLTDTKIESVRKLKAMAHEMFDTVFILPDIDGMYGSAKFVMLKMVEECPNNNKFIATVVDRDHASPTLRSRATMYRMGVYTKDDIREYVQTTYKPSEKDAHKVELVCKLADTPGEVNTLWEYDIDAFYDFVKLTFTNIDKSSGANSFKIADRLSVKDGDGKYDIGLFLKLFCELCIQGCEIRDACDYGDIGYIVKYGKGCTISTKYMKRLTITGINRQFLVDNWILEIRRAWR